MSKNCILFALVFATIAAFAPVAKAVYCPEPTTGGRWPYYCYRQQQCQIWYAGTSVPTWEYSTDVVASNLGGAGSPIVSCGCAEKYMNNNDLQWLVNNAGYHWVTGGGVRCAVRNDVSDSHFGNVRNDIMNKCNNWYSKWQCTTIS